MVVYACNCLFARFKPPLIELRGSMVCGPELLLGEGVYENWGGGGLLAVILIYAGEGVYEDWGGGRPFSHGSKARRGASVSRGLDSYLGRWCLSRRGGVSMRRGSEKIRNRTDSVYNAQVISSEHPIPAHPIQNPRHWDHSTPYRIESRTLSSAKADIKRVNLALKNLTAKCFATQILHPGIYFFPLTVCSSTRH